MHDFSLNQGKINHSKSYCNLLEALVSQDNELHMVHPLEYVDACTFNAHFLFHKLPLML